MMITTPASYRSALEQTNARHNQELPSLPPFALPNNTQPYQLEVKILDGGTPKLANYRAGYISSQTAVLVNKLL